MDKTPIWAWWGWEPLQFYQTSQSAVELPPNFAEDMHAWYDLLHSEETVKAAADLGIDFAVTHFVKGFGLANERAEMENTRMLAERCHRHGIRVCGYLQFGTLFHRQFFQETPEAQEWIQVKEDGTPQWWCGNPERYLPCVNADEFFSYLKQVIRIGLTETGLDALHFDNFYSRPCYCPRCRQAFRAETGMELPAESLLEQTDSPWTDPVLLTWIKWRCARLAKRQRELAEYARSLKPDTLIIWNPSPIRGLLNQPALRATDPRQLGPTTGFLWAEGGNFPGVAKDGKLVHQVNFYKTAEALDYRVFSTVWTRDREGDGLPARAAAIELYLAEAMVFHGCLGTNWLLRPGRLQEFLNCGWNNPMISAFARYVAFFRKHEDIYAQSQPANPIAVQLDYDECIADYQNLYGRFLLLQQILLQNHLPFDLSFTPDQHHSLVLNTATALPEAWNAREFITGDYRSASSLPSGHEELARQWTASAQDSLPCQVLQAKNTTVAELRRLEDGRHALHLLNYQATDEPAVITFRSSLSTVHLLTPENEATLSPASNGFLTLPPFRTLATLIW